MGWQDRPYNQHGPGQSFSSRLTGASVVMWLLGINGVVFLLGGMLGLSDQGLLVWGNPRQGRLQGGQHGHDAIPLVLRQTDLQCQVDIQQGFDALGLPQDLLISLFLKRR